MKRLFCFLVFAALICVSAQGRAVFFANTIVEFKTGQEPEIVDGLMHYQQDVLWTWQDGGDIINLHEAQETDFMWEAITTGDLQIAEGRYQRKVDDTHFILNGSDIYFTGTSGTITVTATNPDFYGVPYTCTYTILYHMGINSTKWDFNSKHYSFKGNWGGEQTYMNATNAPVFHKVNDGLSGDMGSVIDEGAGLIVSASDGNFGGNDPEGDTPDENRYVILGQGGTITIPASIFSSYTNKPRVRIKMDRWGGNECYLTITNGEDALGTQIKGTGAYQIGGSSWWGEKKDYNYRGEYHFIVHNRNNPFTIKVENNQNQCLKILSIEVYDSDEIMTENSMLGDNYQLGNVEGGEAKTGTYYLHYRGRDEHTTINPSSISTTGTVTCNMNNLTTGGNHNLIQHTYTSNVGEFGTFRFRIDCWTQDRTNSGTRYCTDYAWRTNSVGYMQKRSYPYTWDFTDVKPYASDGMTKEAQYTASASDVKSNSVEYNPVARCLWKKNGDNYELQLAADAGHNVHYCGDTQLWYGDQIIPELQYLAFTPVNYDAVYDGALTITSEGLKFDQNIRDWWLWRIMIPSVPTNGVIYVRAKEIRDDSFCNVGYYYGNATNKTNKDLFNANADGTTNVARKFATSDGDVIYVVPAPASETNVTLFFTGVIVKKISVSTDFKTVNKLGWATESRERVIDQELTSYFTNHEFKTYIVTGADNTNKTVTLQEVNTQDKVMKKTSVEGGQEAYVIRNMTLDKTDSSEPGRVKVLAGGFHLFVPDMHDYVEENENNETNGNVKDLQDMSSSLLKAQLGQGTVSQKGEGSNVYNYVLTTETASVDANGNENPRNSLDYVGFFRVQKNGVTSNGHQGYLPITVSGSTNAKYSIVFDNDWTVETPTGIVTPASNESINGKTIYYNLNGQRLNGQPSKGGIYIVNGKKVILK